MVKVQYLYGNFFLAPTVSVECTMHGRYKTGVVITNGMVSIMEEVFSSSIFSRSSFWKYNLLICIEL